MPEALLVLAVAIIGAVAACLVWILRELKGLKAAQTSSEALMLLQQQLGGVQQALQSGLKGVDDTSRQVVSQMAQVQASSARVEELGRSLNSLQDILKPTKLRGEMGETLLRNLLEQALPAEHLAFQRAFRSGARVDAVVLSPQGMVPIDSKFPLESFLRLQRAPDEDARTRARQEFRRALKTQIDEIASKYICPDEGTLDFAFMYIPAEGIYGELAAGWDAAQYGDDLIAYARARRVIPVSPNTLFAYLQTVLMGLKGMKIEAEAKVIREGLARLQSDMERLLAKSGTLAAHLRNAAQTHEGMHKDLGGLGSRLSGLSGRASS